MKLISDMYEQALPLEEDNNKLSRENTVDAIVEAVLCKYEEGAKKASSQVYVEALSLEEDAEKPNSEK